MGRNNKTGLETDGSFKVRKTMLQIQSCTVADKRSIKRKEKKRIFAGEMWIKGSCGWSL